MESDDLRTPLRRQLSAAVREHDRPAVSALRNALAALDNAEAVRPGEDFQPEVSQHIAGGVAGVGAAEVERRVLDVESQRALVRAEIESSLTAAMTYQQHGRRTRAAELRMGADVLAAVLNSTT
ncbi:MAG: yqey-like family protein [Propionibacteriaceae bacterium]|nr:yqey-like family protein [Propionibacteriaceae bacterium]